MGRAAAKEVIGQMINEVVDRCDVEGRMKTWDGGAPGVVAHKRGDIWTAKFADGVSWMLMCYSK